MNANRRHAIDLLLVLAALTGTRGAAGQQKSGDEALAQTLFDEAMRLLDQRNYSEACPKLQESHRLDPAGGTVLNLALCREKEGKLVLAWVAFKEAAGRAASEGRKDREATAREHLAAIEPRIPRVVIAVPTGAPRDLEVRLDGVLVGNAGWGVPAPVELGHHDVSARAPGRKAWSTSVEATEGGTLRVVVPELAPEASASSTPPSVAPASDNERPKRTTAWIVGGTGLAFAAVGAVMGLIAMNKWSQSNQHCSGDTCTDPEGPRLASQAQTFAWAADVGIALGLVGIGAGVFLYVTAAPSPSGPTTGGVRASFPLATLGGRF